MKHYWIKSSVLIGFVLMSGLIVSVAQPPGRGNGHAQSNNRGSRQVQNNNENRSNREMHRGSPRQQQPPRIERNPHSTQTSPFNDRRENTYRNRRYEQHSGFDLNRAEHNRKQNRAENRGNNQENRYSSRSNSSNRYRNGLGRPDQRNWVDNRNNRNNNSRNYNNQPYQRNLYYGNNRYNSRYYRGSYRHPARLSYHVPNRGYRVTHFNFGYNSVFFSGINYRFASGIFYRPFGNDFVVVAPPIGISINVLPIGYHSVYVGGQPYYYYANTFYRPIANNNYEVVEPPLGTRLPALPRNAKEVYIDDERYFEDDGTYYMEEWNINLERLYTVVGVNGVLNTNQVDLVRQTYPAPHSPDDDDEYDD